MKVSQLKDVDGRFLDVKTSKSGVPMVVSDPGDKIPGLYNGNVEVVSGYTISDTALSIQLPAVPAGYIYWVHGITIGYTGTLTGRTFMVEIIDASGHNFTAFYNTSLALSTVQIIMTFFMFPTWYIRAYNSVNETNKTLYLIYLYSIMRTLTADETNQ